MHAIRIAQRMPENREKNLNEMKILQQFILGKKQKIIKIRKKYCKKISLLKFIKN